MVFETGRVWGSRYSIYVSTLDLLDLVGVGKIKPVETTYIQIVVVLVTRAVGKILPWPDPRTRAT